MIVLILCIALIFIIISIVSEKKLFNPISAVFFLWGMITFLSTLGLSGLFSTKTNKPYEIILVGLLSFGLGFYFLKFVFLNSKSPFLSKKNNSQNKVNYHLIYFLIFLSILISFMKFLDMGISFKNGFSFKSLSEQISSSGSEKHSPIINALYYLIGYPLYLPTIVIFSYELVLGNKDKKLCILSVILIGMYLLTTGGRIAIIQLGICILTCLSCLDRSKKANKKKIKKVVFLLIPSILIFFIIETLSKDFNVLENFVNSFSIQPKLLEYWVSEIGNDRVYGLCSLNGVFYPFFYILKNFLGFPFPTELLKAYDTIQKTFSDWIIIGTSLKCNAYTSSFWYFYYDFGLFGVFFGMIILGVISFLIFTSSKGSRNNKNIMNYCILMVLLIYSFTDFELSKGTFALSLIYLNFLYISSKRIKKRRPVLCPILISH